MKYTLTFTEGVWQSLQDHLLQAPRIERGAYLFARLSKTTGETRILVNRWVPVLEEDIEEASSVHMKIRPQSYLRAMKEADRRRECFWFVHSHPSGATSHSPQDDREEGPLFQTAHIRIHTPGVHGSLIFSDRNILSARVWLADGSVQPITRTRVVGNRFRFFDKRNDEEVPDHFDRQVRAFGEDTQRLLAKLTVGVVGAGGTGSATIQQLVRLGVARILVSDGQEFDKTNVNRVHGSSITDHGTKKTEIVKRSVEHIGLGTELVTFERPITFASVLSEFRDSDVVFGCTDDEWSRSLLNKFSSYYLIPVFDMGVKIDSEIGVIGQIEGRVTTLVPGQACLFCRRRITAERVAAEARQELDPAGAEALRREGYAPELENPAPAVVMFTTAVASTAVSEFVHRLTGFLGDDRTSSEVIHRILDTKLSTNSAAPSEECFCGDPKQLGRGDTDLFLNVTWRPE